jgi:uncharacterized membrane protein YdjX (TVP38/TMEM64 family)
MERITSAKRWILLGGVAASGLVVCGLAWWWLRDHGYDLHQIFSGVLAQVRGLGPWPFFTLMALLPAVGAPISLFTLTAGPLFASALGLPVVLLLALVSVAVNLALSYVLARWLLRPWVERLCAWLGVSIPAVSEADHRALVILVRVTPGTPYVLQSYLLGMAKIPMAVYFVISWVVASLYACAFIVFGDALAHGKGRGVLLGVSLLVALGVGVKFLRKKLTRKSSPIPKVEGSGEVT